MAKLTKIKTRPKGGATEILVLVNHPMETGNRVNAKTKEKIPAHFIQKLTVEVNGKAIAVADLREACIGAFLTRPSRRRSASWSS